MIKNIGALLLLLLIFWPWGVALIDTAFWAVSGNPITNIDWSGARGFVLSVWPLVWVIIVGIFV